jgi:hypothetical protein
MSNKRATAKLIECPVYSFDILAVVGGTIEQARAAFKKRFEVECSTPSEETHGLVAALASFGQDNTGYALIWFKKPKPPGYIVAHECAHVSRYIINRAGVIEEGPWEAECYLHGWLVQQVGRLVW